ncbi:NAD(P)-binding protein [Thozetella sp. PMI_491]|nr:NAD(P)-binding protein [Thozetella sp. PMI_491]
MAPFPSPTAIWHSTAYPSISPTRPELSAKGKAVVVTGGGTGIGAETARCFAQAGAARIALLGRREQPLLDTQASIEQGFPGVEVFAIPTDVTEQSQVDAAFSKFAGTREIHIVVSNAALVGPPETVTDVEAEKFLDAVQKHLKGALFVAQAFLRYASSDAVVINVSSFAAHLNIAPQFASYNVAKLAVFRLWDTLACGNSQLSVFHIQPGVVQTAMNKESGGGAAFGIEDHVSLPGSFNVWLASPEARFLKGKFLWANWDVDELKAKAGEIGSTEELNIGLVGWPFQNPDWMAAWKFVVDKLPSN